MVRDILVDDVGSFPILKEKKDSFDEYYLKAYHELVNNNNDVTVILDHRGLNFHVYEPIIHSFRMKLATGLDVVNYPQHFDMNLQFSRPIDLYPSGSGDLVPYLIDASKAIVPEVLFIQHYVNNTPVEELGIPEYSASAKQVQLKVCITGPIELYIKSDMGFTVYKEILANLSKSVNAFAKSSIINDERIRTAVVCIDEPSLGFINLFNIDEHELVECLDLALADLPNDVAKQIHLHTLADVRLPLQTKNIGVLTCEYASDPSNVIDRAQLEQYHKKMRVGICRTNYNAIIGKMYEDGVVVGTSYEDQIGLVDGEEKIATTLAKAIDHYGRENLAFVGPDCGLSSWTPPELAQLLLKRVVSVVQDNVQ